MAWKIEYTGAAQRQLVRLGMQASRRILDYMDTRIAPLENPRHMGRPLTGPLGSYWRYRIGDFRVICDIQDETVRILVVRVGGRGQVYR